MRDLVAKAADIWSLLPTWSLRDSSDEALANHIVNLRIPSVAGGRPSLLLHDLGEGEGENERLQRVFSFSTHTCVT